MVEKLIYAKNIDIQFLSHKLNNFDQLMFYFKIVDQKNDDVMKPIMELNEKLNIKLPFWISCDGYFMLSVKSTCLKRRDFERNQIYKTNMVFRPYLNEDKSIRGYAVTLCQMIKTVTSDD